ncbi:MAG: hypothetical protein NC411_01285 [Bacteroides sp.]|nr:hypothetical protein [Bacteroides sp.]
MKSKIDKRLEKALQRQKNSQSLPFYPMGMYNNIHTPALMYGLSPRFAIIDELKEDDEKMQLSKRLDSETLFRFAYVPFVIAKLVWDYADTVLTIVSQLRPEKTKPLSRAVKELHREYEQIRAPYIDKKHEQSEEDNMVVFEDGVADIMRQLVLNIQCDLKSEYPDINEDYLILLIAVYQCDITLRALLLYTQRQADRIAKRLNKNVGRILPRPMYALRDIIIEFVGDMPVSEKFGKLKRQYIETFATQMALIELNELPNRTVNE